MKRYKQKTITGILTTASVISILLSPLGSMGGTAQTPLSREAETAVDNTGNQADTTVSAAPTASPTPSPAAVTRITDKNSNGIYKVLTSTKNGGTVTLQKPLKDSAKAEIPATITARGKKYKVTGISARAFFGRGKLKSVTIGKYVTSIGTKAFYNCTSIREITLPAKINQIGAFAFYNCRKMNAISIESKKLTSKNIGRDAFYRTGNINYKKLIVDVPNSKLRAHTNLLRRRGMSPKTIIMPPGANIEEYMPKADPVELSKNYVSLTINKSNSGTKYEKAAIKVKRAKGVHLKTATCTVKKQGIVAVSLKGNNNLTMKVTAKKTGSTKIVLTVRYQKGRRIRTKKLILEVEVTLKDTRSKTTATPKPGNPASPTPAPPTAVSPSPTPDPDEPTSTPTKNPQNSQPKNENEVAALKRIITEQKKLGPCYVSEDIDNDEYKWNANGHLVEIHWDLCYLSGRISFSEFPQLESLHLWSNGIAELDVNGCVALKTLDCGWNNLTSLNVSKNTALEKLSCYGGNNRLASLDVSKNTSLTDLFCDSNQLTSLDVSKNTALETLSCTGNQLTNLDVSSNTSLTSLYCNDNNLSALSIRHNRTLKTLKCSGNLLTTLDVSNNSYLEHLTCAYNLLTALDISQNTDLNTLSCYGNQLSTLDVSKNIRLNYLWCFDNQLNTLDMKNQASLRIFECDKNVRVTNYEDEPTERINSKNAKEVEALKTIVAKQRALGTHLSRDLNNEQYNWGEDGHLIGIHWSYSLLKGVLSFSGFSQLKDLRITGNQITELDISSNTTLEYLDCSINQLTFLDVSRNTALKYLYCGSNQLSSLDVSRNTALTSLDCSSNQLSSLDVSRNTALKYLDCSNNQLSSLDVSRNTALELLFCYDNQLSSLDVSGNTALEELDCKNNQISVLYLSENSDWWDLTYDDDITVILR